MKTCHPMFFAALFIITKNLKELKCAVIGESIKNVYYIYAMEYYSMVKRNELLKYAKHVRTSRESCLKAKQADIQYQRQCDSIYMKLQKTGNYSDKQVRVVKGYRVEAEGDYKGGGLTRRVSLHTQEPHTLTKTPIHMYVYSSLIHNRPKLETTPILSAGEQTTGGGSI